MLIFILIRPAQNELHLLWVSYAILFTFLLVEFFLNVLEDFRLVMAPTMLFTYIAYSLLPVRLQQAIIAGVILSSSQLLTESFLHPSTTTSESVSIRCCGRFLWVLILFIYLFFHLRS